MTELGLSIAKHLMQRHCGSLDIGSEAGRGSRFPLWVPVGRLHDAA